MMNMPGAEGHREERVPLKVNAFEVVRGSNSQLLPLFPYVGAGAIVPCSAAFESDGSGTNIGYFLHENTVDEVALTLGSNGRARTGDMAVGPREHGVGGDSSEPFFAVMVITQRQLDEGEQTEAMSFQCEKCNTVLHRYEFDEHEGGEGAFAGLPTIMGSDAAALGFNASEEARTCPSCGHVSRPFPLYIWGWSNYTRNTRIAKNAWNAMEEVIS
ncbi:hypothetical protein [Novosphingobium sp. RL4]|uniref:hypothetical protein n=1 Tax=Novosphingobium sp. RL4 TaxID=3109595 RepID=UPI002D779D9F|nr:hypothetical protein [Novosphingobium sp. RL4]WRT94418.1 hypothetical protein U9J33_07930 [Novosphingobium sp. RL4]